MPTFFEAVLNGWWQGIVLTFLVWIAMRDQTRISAATRLAIWQVTLAVVLALPLLQWLPSLNPPARTKVATAQTPSAPEASVVVPSAPQRPQPAVVEIEERDIAPLFVVAGLLLAGVQMLRLLVGYIAIWRLKRKSIVCDVPLPKALSRDARILIHSRIGMPMAVGYRNPAILLPERMIRGLSADQIEQVVLHEAAHLERRDDWFGLLERLVRALFCIQPAVWFIGRRIDSERELACDDWVVARAGEAKPYAEALARVAEIGTMGWRPILATGAGRRKEIFERMEALLDQTRNKIPSASEPMVLAAALLLVFVVMQSTPFSRLFGLSAYNTRSVVSDGNTRREFEVRGEIQYSDNEQEVESLSPGSKLSLSRGETWVTRSVEIEADDEGKITRRYFVGGVAQPYGAEAKRFLAKELPQWLKDQPVHLEERLARWVDTEGIEGALRQIEGATNGGVKRQYLEGLLRRTALDSIQTRRLLRIAEQLHSDEDKGRIAELVGEQARSMGIEPAMIDLVLTMHSEEERARLLDRMLTEVQDAMLPRLLRAIGELHSDERKADLLVHASQELKRALPLAFFETAKKLNSEDQRKRVLLSAMEHHGAEPVAQLQILEQAGKLHSEEMRRGVLLTLLDQPQVAAENLAEVKRLATQMHSSEDREAVLKQLSSR